MRNKVFGTKFNRSGHSRTAMFRGLVRSLVENGKTHTTETRAKALQQEMDKIFQLLRKDTIASRRNLTAKLGNDTETVNKLYQVYLPLAKSRVSGFTTLNWEGERRGDNARIALIELIQVKEKPSAKPKAVKSSRKVKENEDNTKES